MNKTFFDEEITKLEEELKRIKQLNTSNKSDVYKRYCFELMKRHIENSLDGISEYLLFILNESKIGTGAFASKTPLIMK